MNNLFKDKEIFLEVGSGRIKIPDIPGYKAIAILNELYSASTKLNILRVEDAHIVYDIGDAKTAVRIIYIRWTIW